MKMRCLTIGMIGLGLLTFFVPISAGQSLLDTPYPFPTSPTNPSVPDGWTTTPALVALPDGATVVDYVDIGDPTGDPGWGTEADHAVYECIGQHASGAWCWGPVATWGGSSERPSYEQTSGAGGSDRRGTLTMDFGANAVNKYVGALWLWGAAAGSCPAGDTCGDGWDLEISGYSEVYHMVNSLPQSNGDEIIGVFDVGVVTGVHTVTFTANADAWTGQDSYGQALISEVAVYEAGAELLFEVPLVPQLVEPGQPVTVELKVNNLSMAINGVQALFHYDTSLLTLDSIVPVDLGLAPPAQGWLEINEIDTNGDVAYTVGIAGGSVGPGGPFTVATLTFSAVAVGSPVIEFLPDHPPAYPSLVTRLIEAEHGQGILPSKTNIAAGDILIFDDDSCVIDGGLYSRGEPNPENECEACDPDFDQFSWNALADGTSCDLDGLFCTADTCTGGTCVAGGDPCTDDCEQCNEDQDTCDWCRFDLDQNGVIGTGDIGIFSGCYGRMFSPGDPDYATCLEMNYDNTFGEDACGLGADPGCYVIGTGDVGVLSGCYGGTCAECSTCWE